MVLDLSFEDMISSLKTIGEIIKGLFGLKKPHEIEGIINKLQSALTTTNNAALELQARYAAAIEEIRNLKEETVRIKAWETEKKRYKLVSAWEGTVLYALKKTMSSSEPAHYICTNCYEDGRKSILRPRRNTFYVLSCPACKSEFHSDSMTRPKPQYAEE